MRSSHSRAGPILEAELADGAVSNVKLAAGAVGTNKIADGAVTTAKIAAGAVTGAEIATATVDTANLAPLCIGSGKIQDAAVGSGKLGSNACRQSNMWTSTNSIAGVLGAGSLEVYLDSGSFFPMIQATPNGAWQLEPVSSPAVGADNPRFAMRAAAATAYDVRWRRVNV